jgi:hypothetical protein
MSDSGCPIDKDGCRICFDAIATTEQRGLVTPCRHSHFHAKCLQAWRSTCAGPCRCPCCNGVITELYITVNRRVPPNEVFGKKVTFWRKLTWTNLNCRGWYQGYILATSVWMVFNLWRVGSPYQTLSIIQQACDICLRAGRLRNVFCV